MQRVDNPGVVLLLGARSDIGGEIAVRICSGREVVLAARGSDGLDDVKRRLLAAGATVVRAVNFDATNLDSHRRIVREAGEVTSAIVAFGILGDQELAERDEREAACIATVDYVAQVNMLTVLADEMARGEIFAFSSIAGWRARRANYVYGSTKAGLDAFCQGLSDKLHGTGLNLILARPGFVIGAMTEGMKPAIMSVTPDVVADAVVEAAVKGRSTTVWIPRRLTVLATIMRLVPRPIWRHMPR
ncbi:oxidoreductase [Corynebacterium sp. HMSC067D03]|uniref:SDR family oxidoreductase n=1 Tax=Corynebacterium coyleae TaxID=53374 RepID=A0AAP6XNH1_9CORY|nr:MULTISPECIES: SDR family oxidoreductase [Corynebacterium]MDK8240777.1 SDR family oxidoreductase [Corynebacterium coyleae]MDK8663110.1 SDR family oxidoreductase [Corynebacterium coyleae]MDK8705844.1 SDR family oxidoreductase [Corynebacterium coyleae]MDK8733069.1 SDR family oxidoreductase [Corynebacterium coyleae]MDK8799183.1 SDR family oxidoreductase [Corynebacterium coyleae]